MSCYTEKELEFYVIRELDNASVPENFKEHMKYCTFCRKRYDRQIAFYKSLGENLSAGVTQKEQVKLEAILNKNHAKKLTNIVIRNDFFNQFQKSVLHAETVADEPNPYYKTVAVKISDDEKILVRILENLENGSKILYLISLDENLVSKRKILINNKAYCTDRYGRVELGNITVNRDVEIILKE